MWEVLPRECARRNLWRLWEWAGESMKLSIKNLLDHQLEGMRPLQEIEFSDEWPSEGIHIVAKLENGDKQYLVARNLAFPIGRIQIKKGGERDE